MIDWESFKNQMQSNPGKLLKSVILLAGCLLFIWILVMIEGGSPTKQTVHIQKSGRLDSLSMYSNRTASHLSDNHSSSKTQAQGLPNNNAGSGLYVLLPTAFIFLVLLGGLWFWLRSKQTNASAGNLNGEIFTTIASQKIPGGQQLLVIKLNGEYWVMATGGNQSAELLHRYTSEEWKTLERRPLKEDEERTFWQTLKEKASQNNKRTI